MHFILCIWTMRGIDCFFHHKVLFLLDNTAPLQFLMRKTSALILSFLSQCKLMFSNLSMPVRSAVHKTCKKIEV